MDDKEKTVGAILKEARLAKGISLADAEKGYQYPQPLSAGCRK